MLAQSLFLISIFGSCFLLLCLSYVSRWSFVLWVFLFSTCCFVSNHKIRFLSICILFCCYCFWLVFLLWNLIFLDFWIPIKTSLPKLAIPKPPKWQMQKKKDFWQQQLAQVCSQIVCFIFGVSLKFTCAAENTIKLWFQPFWTRT